MLYFPIQAMLIQPSVSSPAECNKLLISLTSTDGGTLPLTAERLEQFCSQLDDYMATPINTDNLSISKDLAFLKPGQDIDDNSPCVTPVSCTMDISLIANRGSMTFSVDEFEDDDDATLSPTVPTEEFKLETCYCCPTHAESSLPEDNIQSITDLDLNYDQQLAETNHPVLIDDIEINTLKPSLRKCNEPISPKIFKQISYFESGVTDYERRMEYATCHASINIPAPGTQQLKSDSRLRKFEQLTQSTSNSNFPFESNTLKKSLPLAQDLAFVDISSQTQSCINLKSSAVSSVAASSFLTESKLKKLDHSQTKDNCRSTSSTNVGALNVREKIIDIPTEIPRTISNKAQSMDADFMFNEPSSARASHILSDTISTSATSSRLVFPMSSEDLTPPDQK